MIKGLIYLALSTLLSTRVAAEVVELGSGTEHLHLTEDATKDALVMYYAPWCGHCKKLKPVFEELGQYAKDCPDVVIAKLDRDAHTVISPQIKGYPTLYFYPKEGDSKLYEGGRTLQAFKDYLFVNSEAYRTTFPGDEPSKISKKAANAGEKKAQEPQPDDEHVKVLVASNHNEMVGDKSKDTLVMYYAPWCGHCKKLAPHWRDLAKEM